MTVDQATGDGDNHSLPKSTLHVIEGYGFVVLGLEGEFDVWSAPQIDDRARQALADRRDLIFDLSDTSFIDSAIVQILLRTHSEASDNGLACVLQLGTAAIVERLIEITGLARRIPRARTRAEGLEMLRHEAEPHERRAVS